MTRFRLLPSLFAIALLSGVLARSAHAHDTYEPPQLRAPSVFSYAGKGFLIGTFSGFAGGYLVARADSGREDWRTLLLGTGIGALTGSGVGLTLGIFDLVDDHPGTGAIALRDLMYGTGFGILAGATVGGLVALRSADAEHIAFGGAIGALSGAALGLAVGLFEGPRVIERRRRHPSHAPSVHPTESKPSRPIIIIGSAQDAKGGLVWMPTVAGRL